MAPRPQAAELPPGICSTVSGKSTPSRKHAGFRVRQMCGSGPYNATSEPGDLGGHVASQRLGVLRDLGARQLLSHGWDVDLPAPCVYLEKQRDIPGLQSL